MAEEIGTTASFTETIRMASTPLPRPPLARPAWRAGQARGLPPPRPPLGSPGRRDARMEDLLYEVRDGIGFATLNRPQARNALTFPMYERLAALCAEVAEDPAVRALVVTGAGDKAFAAGTDISQFREFRTAEDALAYEARVDRVLTAIEGCPKPTIAAIAGACTGGGAAIAAVCDMRLGTADARIGFPIAKTLGNCLSMANYARLAALIGPARVIDLVYTARLVGAEEARSIGLLSEVLPDPAALLARAGAR